MAPCFNSGGNHAFWERMICLHKLEGDEATDYLLLLLLVFHSVPESEVPRIAPSEFSTTQGIGTPGEGS
ncbi:unnamed protein product [Musa textilis]